MATQSVELCILLSYIPTSYRTPLLVATAEEFNSAESGMSGATLNHVCRNFPVVKVQKIYIILDWLNCTYACYLYKHSCWPVQSSGMDETCRSEH